MSPFTIPNEAAAGFQDQAKFDSVDLDIMTAGMGETGVLSGCEVTAQGTPDMTLAVAAGYVKIAGDVVAVAAGNVTVTTAHATNPRFDLVVVNSSGTKSVVAGTASDNPVFPAHPANSVVLRAVYVPANDTAIGSTQLVDKRVMLRPPDSVADYVIYANGDGTFAAFSPIGRAPIAATADPGALLNSCFAGLGGNGSAGGTILIAPNTNLLYTTTVPAMPVNITGKLRILGMGGVTFTLVSGAPRVFDIGRTANGQSLKNIELGHFHVDGNSTGGFHHVLIGNYINAVWHVSAQDLSVDRLHFHDITGAGALAENDDDGVTSTPPNHHRLWIWINPLWVSNPVVIQNIVFERIHFEDGNLGFFFGTSSINPINGVIVKDCVLRDCVHDRKLIANRVSSCNGIHIGSRAVVRNVLIDNCRVFKAGDCGYEINNGHGVVVRKCLSEDAVQANFFAHNFANGNGEEQEITFVDCVSRRTSLQPGSIAGSSPPLGFMVQNDGIARAGTTTNASAVVTGISQTNDFMVGQLISGTGIQADSQILTIDSSSQITMTKTANASGTNTLNWGLDLGSVAYIRCTHISDAVPTFASISFAADGFMVQRTSSRGAGILRNVNYVDCKYILRNYTHATTNFTAPGLVGFYMFDDATATTPMRTYTWIRPKVVINGVETSGTFITSGMRIECANASYDIDGYEYSSNVSGAGNNTQRMFTIGHSGITTQKHRANIRNSRPVSFSGDTTPRFILINESNSATVIGDDDSRIHINGCDLSQLPSGGAEWHIPHANNKPRVIVERNRTKVWPAVPITFTPGASGVGVAWAGVGNDPAFPGNMTIAGGVMLNPYVEISTDGGSTYQQVVNDAAVLRGSAAGYNPPSIAAGAETSTTVTVTGAEVGDPVIVGFTGLTTQDVVIAGAVQATNTVRVFFSNVSASAIDMGAGTVNAYVFKSSLAAAIYVEPGWLVRLTYSTVPTCRIHPLR